MRTKKIKLEITCEEANLLLRLVKQHKEKSFHIHVDFKELASYMGEEASYLTACFVRKIRKQIDALNLY